MRFSPTNIILATLFSGYFCLAPDANAQQSNNPNENCAAAEIYQPSDPWTRGKLYNIQTGNSGLFFNCDGEQAKRNSPYIYWQPITEKALPTRKGIWRSIKQDIAEVKQRVSDSSCCDLGCSSADCPRARKNGNITGCAATVNNRETSQKSCDAGTNNASPNVAPAIENSSLVPPSPETPLSHNVSTTQSLKRPVVTPQNGSANHGTKFGLIQYRRPPAAVIKK